LVVGRSVENGWLESGLVRFEAAGEQLDEETVKNPRW